MVSEIHDSESADGCTDAPDHQKRDFYRTREEKRNSADVISLVPSRSSETNERTVVHERYILHQRQQLTQENFEQYLEELRFLVKPCEYGDQEDDMLRDQIVFGVKGERLRDDLLAFRGLTVEKAIELCREAENLLKHLDGETVSAFKEERVKSESSMTQSECQSRGRSQNDVDSFDSTTNDIPTRVEEVYVNLEGEGTVKCEPLESDSDQDNTSLYKLRKAQRVDIKHQISAEYVHTNIDPNIPYSCDVCPKQFNSKSSLKKHSVTHAGEQIYKCQICKKRFCLQENFNRHIKLHTTRSSRLANVKRPYRCRMCNKSFASNAYVKQHMLIHTGQRRYKFGNSGKQIITKSNLNQHSATYKGERHMCEYCKKTFAKKDYLKKHISIHTSQSQDIADAKNENVKEHCQSDSIIVQSKKEISDSESLDEFDRPLGKLERKYNCKTCSKSFFIKQSLSSHMLVHTGERPHKCDECNKSFSTKGHLSEHVMIHKHIRPHQCEICSKSFLRKWNFNQHMLIHSGKHQYKCSICNKSFAVKDYLKKHSLTHLNENAVLGDSIGREYSNSQEQSYFCKPCNKGFTTKQFLDRHLSTHEKGLLTHAIISRLTRYRCTICNKYLSGKRALENHMLTHTGGRPHQCHICSKCFSQKGSLNVHLLIHTGERPHRCGICGKSFPSKDYAMKKHILIHTGERPYCCESCGKRFAVKSNLNKHMLIHKNERPYECEVCRKNFTRKQDLKKHFPIHQRQQ